MSQGINFLQEGQVLSLLLTEQFIMHKHNKNKSISFSKIVI